MKDLKDFKFFQIGLGSMGRRRIRNLLYHGIKSKQIIGFDIQSDRIAEAVKLHGITPVYSFAEGIKKFNPEVFIISTPPNTHWKYFIPAAKNKKHFFVEHPTTDKGYSELKNLMDGSFVGAPSCSMRFYSAVKEIKALLAKKTIGKILSFQYHLGQYLPDWHPWEDYKNVYFSKKETGACREMLPFELIWLTDTLGLKKIKKVDGQTAKLSDLNMTADDYYAAQLSFDNNTRGSVVIDLLARTAFRTLRVIGSKGVLEWEWQKNLIRFFDVKRKTWQDVVLKRGRSEKGYITTEDLYESEVGAFLNAITGKKKYPFTFQENHQFIKTLFALEKSSKSGKTILL